MSYGLEIFKSGSDSCIGNSSNVCIKDGIHLTAHTNAVDCINIGAGDWIAPINTASCSSVGGTWTNPLIYSSADVTWNQIDSFIASAGVTVDKSYAYLTGAGVNEIMTVQFMVHTLQPDTAAKTHTVSVSGTSVTATPAGTQHTYSDTHVVVLGR
jgi:hypothetical protein